MKKIDSYLLSDTIKLFLFSLLFFVVIIELVDLFSNINRYITYEVPYQDIAWIALLYIPKSISYSISPALLFSVTYTISEFYTKNELIMILNSGISYNRFITPLIVFGFIISITSFFFSDQIVTETFKQKNVYMDKVFGFSSSYSNSHPVVTDENTKTIYYAKYYDDKNMQLNSPIILKVDSDGSIISRIDSSKAFYDREKNVWELQEVVVYNVIKTPIEILYFKTYIDPEFSISPEKFRKLSSNIFEMKFSEAREYITSIKSRDMNAYLSGKADLYERISFSFTPLLVVLFSAAFGWKFKKNILLFSILLSLSVSVLYYIFEMVTILFAKQGILSPLIGAWAPLLVFLIIATFLLHNVRT